MENESMFTEKDRSELIMLQTLCEFAHERLAAFEIRFSAAASERLLDQMDDQDLSWAVGRLDDIAMMLSDFRKRHWEEKEAGHAER